jgi:gamma-glutamylcyclotransferase (GGCT)/AIG2-like uncharacterized protein YtfP
MRMVAVYGTLKQGWGNHRLLAESTFVKDDVITSAVLYDLGPFPGAKQTEDKNDSIQVEVYEVDDATFRQLDSLEGYYADHPTQGLYNRVEVITVTGLPVWTYIYNGDVSGSGVVDKGNWLKGRYR